MMFRKKKDTRTASEKEAAFIANVERAKRQIRREAVWDGAANQARLEMEKRAQAMQLIAVLISALITFSLLGCAAYALFRCW